MEDLSVEQLAEPMSDVHISDDSDGSVKLFTGESEYESSDEDETYYSEEFKTQQSVFAQQNLILKIKGKKIYVNKEQLMKESPVFEAMLTAEFSEKDAEEIDLPGKQFGAMVHFLRCTLPGIDTQVTESTVRQVLPLADEYQTSRTLIKIDGYLAEQCRQRANGITSVGIISNILEAEKYQLKNYLNMCINVASRKYYKNILLKTAYNDISEETKLKICEKRWKDIDTLYEKTNCFRSDYNIRTGYIPMQDIGERLKEFMHNN